MYYDKKATGDIGETLALLQFKSYMGLECATRFTEEMFKGLDIFGLREGKTYTVQVKATTQKIRNGEFGIPKSSFDKMTSFYQSYQYQSDYYIILEGLADCVWYLIPGANLQKMVNLGWINGYGDWKLIPLERGGVKEIQFTPLEAKIAIEYLNGDQLGFDFFEV